MLRISLWFHVERIVQTEKNINVSTVFFNLRDTQRNVSTGAITSASRYV